MTDCGPETTRTDACCYVLEHIGWWGAGRPLVVDGRPRLPSVRKLRGRVKNTLGPRDAGRAAFWTAMARAEHASIASFACFTLELLALGAPAELVASACRAQADEVVHARIAFRLASRFAGGTLAPGPIDLRRMVGNPDPLATAQALAREGCVAETVAAAQAALALRDATDVEEQGALTRISTDERRHAALAWRSAAWMLATFPETRAIFSDELAAAAVHPARLPLERRVVAAVVAPCSRALLGSPR